MYFFLLGNIFINKYSPNKSKKSKESLKSIFFKKIFFTPIESIPPNNSIINITGGYGNKFNSFYVIDDDLNFRGLVHENELIKALKKYGNISIFDYLAIRKNLMNTKNSEE